MTSQITPSQSHNTQPLANIPGTCTLIFSICALFTVYPIRHPTSLQAINLPQRGIRGTTKERNAKQKWPS